MFRHVLHHHGSHPDRRSDRNSMALAHEATTAELASGRDGHIASDARARVERAVIAHDAVMAQLCPTVDDAVISDADVGGDLASTEHRTALSELHGAMQANIWMHDRGPA
jgi:hypothetical protein